MDLIAEKRYTGTLMSISFDEDCQVFQYQWSLKLICQHKIHSNCPYLAIQGSKSFVDFIMFVCLLVWTHPQIPIKNTHMHMHTLTHTDIHLGHLMCMYVCLTISNSSIVTLMMLRVTGSIPHGRRIEPFLFPTSAPQLV